MKNILNRLELITLSRQLRHENKKVVFTNGCFDIVHAGHVDYLTKARAFGDILVVGVNSDKSIKRIKGEKRPIVGEKFRVILLANLKCVDYVTVFDEDTPFELIRDIVPDILIKGGDWKLENIVGRDIVEASGGRVETIQFVNDISTSAIISYIISKYSQ